MRRNPPKLIGRGTDLECKNPTDTMTKGRKYKVRGHFCYLNTYGSGKDKYCMWDEFVTIKNDYDYTIKVNVNKFVR